MSFSSTFIKLVGRAPFTGKHQIAHAYREGTRAVQLGNSERAQEHRAHIRRILLGNVTFAIDAAFVSLGDFAVAYIESARGNEGFVAANIGAAALGVAIAAGHSASAGAQQMILNRFDQVASRANTATGRIEPSPAIAEQHEATQFQKASVFEHIITNGSKALFFAGSLALGVAEIITW